MTRQQVMADYTVDSNGIIRSPGKFEGEPCFVPALWALGMEGLADGDDGKVYRFNIPKGDDLRKEWPELDKWLRRSRRVRLYENEQGFVHAY